MMRISTLSLIIMALLVPIGVWACCTGDLPIDSGANTGLLCSGHDVALGCGLAPNPVPSSHLDIFVDNPEHGLTNLDLSRLIIGIPSTAGAFTPPAIDQVDIYAAYPGSHTSYTPDISATACGSLTPGETNAYHECLGINGGSSSTGNSFTAWHDADNVIGVDPTSFALYYYNLSPITNVNYGGLYDIFLKSALPVGTIEIAYGCAASGTCATDCYYTPFTQAGQVVPEPSTWLMMAAGAALVFIGRRYRKSQS